MITTPLNIFANFISAYQIPKINGICIENDPLNTNKRKNKTKQSFSA